jgi:hypothetical protein
VAAKTKTKSKRAPLDSVLRFYPKQTRGKLERRRELVLDTARKTQGVGKIEEAQKWASRTF